MAKHRYISIKKRLGRLIGKFSAVFSVAEKIRVARPGKAEASHAEAFLREFGEEQFLQLAMLADASDEAYVYTMFADDEGMDIALQAEEVASFVDHIRYLFNDDEGCLAIDGYTKFAREQLQKVRVVNMAKDLPPALPSSSAIIPYECSTGCPWQYQWHHQPANYGVQLVCLFVTCHRHHLRSRVFKEACAPRLFATALQKRRGIRTICMSEINTNSWTWRCDSANAFRGWHCMGRGI